MPKDAPADLVRAIDRHELDRRNEHRFIVSEEVARLAMRTAGTHLDLAKDDRPYQWSTTSYCDTYDWAAYRAAEQGSGIQLRLREYHRTRPAALFTGTMAWIEMKDDADSTSRKERFGVSPKTIPAFLRGEAVLPRQADEFVERASTLIAAGARPVVVTQYNRIAYAAPRDRLRVTADHNLMYLAVPWDSNDDDVVPRKLGPVLARESDVILEVKWMDELPPWASALLEWLGQQSPDRRPSKFVVAMRHLLGRAQAHAS